MFQNALDEKNKLEEALQECREAAREGYKIAKENLKDTTKAIKSVSVNLSNSLKSIDNGSVRTPEVVNQLKSQFTRVGNELETLQQRSDRDIEERKKHLDHFSITLFGRTMAGKSTLMEILTRGNGASIGTGSQRTTRDVRAYSWNGLEVTDVPGVAAFEGAEDEVLAFKAANQADLVIFLITDDAPQPVEAKRFADIKKLGKPVLGICNVKVALNDEDDFIIFLKNSTKYLDRIEISQIITQFNLLVDQHISGKRVPFVVSHLRSQYLAQQNEYDKYRERLVKVSRFSEIEKRIVQEVTGRGAFLRVKSFIDGSVNPMMNLTDKLLEFSEQNSSSGRVLIEKKRNFKDWSDKFETSGSERLKTRISKLMDDLRSEVPAFSEDHFDNNYAGESWNRLIDSKGINTKIDKLCNELLDECQNELSEIIRELKSELSLVADLAGDRHIKMDKIFDSKRALNWATTILAGGLGIAAIVFFSGPLGWAAAAVGVIGSLFSSWFFDDREKKSRRAREKLSRRL